MTEPTPDHPSQSHPGEQAFPTLFSPIRLGTVQLANRVVITSDRRVAAWGALRANWIYLKVGARWGLGFRKGLERHYPDVR